MRSKKNVATTKAISLFLCLLLSACSVHKTQMKGDESETQTTSIAERWQNLKPNAWEAFAKAWLTELSRASTHEKSKVSGQVVFMNFTAAPEQQWNFILISLSLARTDRELAAIAAGPVEHILRMYGDEYIGLIEQNSKNDPKFPRMLSGIWGESAMTDDVLMRVKKLKEQVSAPINLETQKYAHEVRRQLEESTLELLMSEQRNRTEIFSDDGKSE